MAIPGVITGDCQTNTLGSSRYQHNRACHRAINSLFLQIPERLRFTAQHQTQPLLTCTMLGCAMVLLMAASMIAMRSRFSAPDMRAGRIIVFTATVLPRHRPAAQTNTMGAVFTQWAQ